MDIQEQLDKATQKASEARTRIDAVKKYSKDWRDACEDYEFWTNKKANLWAAMQRAA